MTSYSGILLEHVGRQAKVALELGVDSSEVVKATSASSLYYLVVGDKVSLKKKAGTWWIYATEERQNILQRDYFGKLRPLAANLDLLLIVCSTPPEFQPYSLDCMLSIAFEQKIPVWLLANKMDLPKQDLEKWLQIYQGLDYPIFHLSSITGEGFPKLLETLNESLVKNIAFCGLSGVGKSSIINTIIPEAQQKTGSISSRRLLGKQTTSKARGLLYKAPQSKSHYLLIDLPGIQHFGVSSLKEDDILSSFTEFAQSAVNCPYSSCRHLKEDKCKVKEDVASGLIAPSRYNSYVKMITEVRSSKTY